MNFLFASVVVWAAVVFFASCGDGRKNLTLCDIDDDCVNITSRKIKCCVYSFTGTEKICRSLPNEIGDYCGGPYFCGCDPRKNLTCEKLASAVTNEEPATCSPPAAGICVLDVSEAYHEFQGTKYAENEIPEE